MKRKIALLLIVCLLASMLPAATMEGTNKTEATNVYSGEIGEFDLSLLDLEDMEEDGAPELEIDGLDVESFDEGVLPSEQEDDDKAGNESKETLVLDPSEELLEASFDSSMEQDGLAVTTNDSDGIEIENGVLTKYSGTSEEVVIPDGVTSIGDGAFKESSVSKVIMPNGITSIGESAFSECYSLKSVVISNSVISIGGHAFYHCTSLSEINIPDGVVSIGEYAFDTCGFTGITIPGSVTTIGYSAFGYCYALADIVFLSNEGNPISVLDIGDKAFCTCEKLTGITFPSHETRIGVSAFSGCSSLTSVDIPSSVTVIGEFAFDSCAGLKNLTLSNGITVINPMTFMMCSSLISVIIPNSVTSIESSAFWGCGSLTSIVIPDSVVRIGGNVFDYCPNVTISGYTGSYAETYAKDNNIPFTSIGDITPTLAPTATPDATPEPTVDPTPEPTAEPTPEPTAEPTPKPTKPVSIPKKLTLGVKEKYKLGVKDATFKSSKKSIVEVNKKGVIIAKETGTATVTVTVKGQKAQKCKVTVLSAPNSITLSGKSRNMSVGGAIMLMPKLPEKTASKITWTSSNKSVATVNADGVVTALKKGTTKITAKTFNGKKAVCTIKVDNGPSTLGFDIEAISIGVKEKVKLTPVVNEEAKAKFSWSSKGKKIAKVNKKGVVTGVKAGSTDVTVTTQNGLTATVNVTVKAAPTKVTLNKTKAEIAEGATLQLKATLPKKTASQIKWATSANTIATVDKNGLVTAVAPGEATITAKTFNGKTAECVVTVTEETEGDQLKSFWDLYESTEKEELDKTELMSDMLSLDDFENSEGMAEFVEKYNGMANLINETAENYLENDDKIEQEVEMLVSSIGVLDIEATEDTIRVKTDLFSFEMPTDFNALTANNTMTGEETFRRSLEGQSIKNVEAKDIDGYVGSAQKFVANVGNFLSGVGVCLDARDGYLSAMVDYYDKQREIIRQQLTEKMTTADRAKLRDKLKDVVKKYDDWYNKRIMFKKTLETFDKFKMKQIEAGLALGNDLVYGVRVVTLFAHGHPKEGRENNDVVRYNHALMLQENIGEATKWITCDVLYYVGVIACELLLFGKGGIIKSLGTTAAENMGKRYFILAGEKWMKAAYSGGALYSGIRLDFSGKTEIAIGKVKHEDDILHGNIRGTISGIVVDAETQKPIAGVLVESDEKSAYTDSDGKFALSAMYGNYSGKYALKCTKEDYVDAAGEVTVDEGKSDAVVRIEMSVEGVPIDEAHFPDANFRSRVREFDLDGNDSLSDEEIGKITTVTVDNWGIESLEGIQYFTSMVKLSCAQNVLTKLDIMECVALQELDCSENMLSSLTVAGHKSLENLNCSDNPMTMLDVCSCPMLREVYCNGTAEEKGKLMSLNACDCSSLVTLDCSNNAVTLIDVSGCTKLKTLNCGDNQLASLEVGGCKDLQKLFCNTNKLTGLNLSGLDKLTDLNCGDNRLTSLNVSGCNALQLLNCAKNQLASLEIKGCTELEELYLDSNRLTTLVINGCKRLKALNCDSNSLTELDVSGCESLLELDCHGTESQRGKLTKLNVSGCIALQRLVCYGNQLTCLEVGGCTELQKLFCNTNELSSLNVSGLAKLTDLNCGDNQLTSLDVSGCTALQLLNCAVNQLTTLEIKGYPALEELYCNSNRLTALITNGCKSLKVLQFDGNSLTELDVGGCASLLELDCHGTESQRGKLTKLNVSGCIALQRLACYGNQLTSLEVGGCTELQKLFCNTNELSSLNVSGLAKLTDLNCGDNQLTSLDVSGCTALQLLKCTKNKLTSFEIKGCPALEEMYLDSNQLTTLVANGCKRLKILKYDSNLLTELDVSGCEALEELYCNSNRLTSLKASGCKKLKDLQFDNNSLTNLDVSGCASLLELDCQGTEVQRGKLTTLNVSGCTALQWLKCSDNQLNSIDVRGCVSLEYIYLYNNRQLASFNLQNCINLKYIGLNHSKKHFLEGFKYQVDWASDTYYCTKCQKYYDYGELYRVTIYDASAFNGYYFEFYCPDCRGNVEKDAGIHIKIIG